MLYVAMYVYASNRVTVTIICKVKQTARVAGNTEDTDACVRAIGSKLVSSLHNTVFKILLIKNKIKIMVYRQMARLFVLFESHD